MSNASKSSPSTRLTKKDIGDFRRTIYRHYRQQGRDLPWRETHDPYRILVSEVMLQQTQVERVLAKYDQFVSTFPDFRSLAQAALRDVLAVWQGLGYNRRALALQRIAQRVVVEFGGKLPDTVEELQKLPGIGPATAGALTAFAFDQSVVFVETNIRRVFIHFFFEGKTGVRDGQILPLVVQTLDRARGREWYYALMDYGASLKSMDRNPNRRSAHYRRQAPFRDSDREIRGLILKILLGCDDLSEEELVKAVGKDTRRVKAIIRGLIADELLERTGERLRICTSGIPLGLQ